MNKINAFSPPDCGSDLWCHSVYSRDTASKIIWEKKGFIDSKRLATCSILYSFLEISQCMLYIRDSEKSYNLDLFKLCITQPSSNLLSIGYFLSHNMYKYPQRTCVLKNRLWGTLVWAIFIFLILPGLLRDESKVSMCVYKMVDWGEDWAFI